MSTDVMLILSVYICAEMQNINGNPTLDLFFYFFYTFIQHVCENTIRTIDETENIRLQDPQLMSVLRWQ